MKILLLAFVLAGSSFLQAQNVGIGNKNPTEKLDVTGNINVSGTIKANGTDGTANQVLMKNSGGNLAWGSVSSGFGQSAMFTDTTASQTWVVPSGVSKILIEMWGGGGAGLDEGGGSGAYVALLFDNLVAGNSFTVTVGKGGVDKPDVISFFTYGKSGTSSSVVTPSNGTFYANNGTGAFKSPIYGYWVSGDGGSFSASSGAYYFPMYYYQQGQSGSGHDIAWFTTTSGQYNTVTTYGAGADAPNTINTGGKGAKKVENFNGSSTTTQYYVPAKPGRFPGGGGGGGEALNYYENRSGANGMVTIHY